MTLTDIVEPITGTIFAQAANEDQEIKLSKPFHGIPADMYLVAMAWYEQLQSQGFGRVMVSWQRAGGECHRIAFTHSWNGTKF